VEGEGRRRRERETEETTETEAFSLHGQTHQALAEVDVLVSWLTGGTPRKTW
jgi:hypothetical protein